MHGLSLLYIEAHELGQLTGVEQIDIWLFTVLKTAHDSA